MFIVVGVIVAVVLIGSNNTAPDLEPEPPPPEEVPTPPEEDIPPPEEEIEEPPEEEAAPDENFQTFCEKQHYSRATRLYNDLVQIKI